MDADPDAAARARRTLDERGLADRAGVEAVDLQHGVEATMSRRLAEGTMTGMDVTLLHVAGCPSWREAETRLQQALRVAGRADVAVTLTAVSTLEDAERLGFRGSPTVVFDGRDPFADGTAQGALACRLFATPDGLRGAPMVEQLVGVLA